MERILVVLANRENRTLLAQFLTPVYDIHFGMPTAFEIDEEGDADLVILDGSSLEANAEQLSALRAAQEPAMLPVLLLSDRRSVGLMPRTLWKVVDDVVLRPLEKHEMRARVEALIRARRMSLKLSKVSDLYIQERKVAQRFQKAAMPRALPQVPGLVFSAFYRPGTDEAKIGGDWYDALRLADGRIVFSIGDVCGSGLDAAVTMANVRQVIRGVAQIHADPAMMLDAADRTLAAEDPTALVTAFVGVFDPVTSLISYASAGHPRPLVRESNGTISELTADGVPVGMGELSSGVRTVFSRVLPEHSLLVLYTDGLTEATRDVIDGEKRLYAALANDEVLNAPNVALAIHDIVVAGEAHDDVAVLAVGFVPRGIGVDSLRHWSFDVTDPEAAREAKNAILQVLQQHDLSQHDLHTAELVFAELIGNVVRHAPKWVDITLDSSGAFPVLHVLDAGPGFEHIPRLPPNTLSERGRGLFIVSELTQDFSVVPRPHGGSHARAVLLRAVG